MLLCYTFYSIIHGPRLGFIGSKFELPDDDSGQIIITCFFFFFFIYLFLYLCATCVICLLLFLSFSTSETFKLWKVKLTGCPLRALNMCTSLNF